MLEMPQSRLLLCSFADGSPKGKNLSSHENFRRISGSSVKVSMIKSAGTFVRSCEKRSPCTVHTQSVFPDACQVRYPFWGCPLSALYQAGWFSSCRVPAGMDRRPVFSPLPYHTRPYSRKTGVTRFFPDAVLHPGNVHRSQFPWNIPVPWSRCNVSAAPS